jgi:two-component system cell cycle sensor histidine kinase/response regulator CckA
VRDVALARSARLAALGELSAGLAHDLRNTLGGLALRLSLVEADPGCTAAQRDNLVMIDRVLRDAMAALRRLQDVASGRPERRPETADLAEVIGDAVLLAHTGTGALLRIEAKLPALPRVLGSPPELKHVFLNLFLNARDAMGGGGRIRVRVRPRTDAVVVTVADDGAGIPLAARPHIFEPFFTTKGKRGLGLGLSVARGVLTRLGGEISVVSRRGGGATFRLVLPVAKLSPAGRAAPRAAAARRRSGPAAS